MLHKIYIGLPVQQSFIDRSPVVLANHKFVWATKTLQNLFGWNLAELGVPMLKKNRKLLCYTSFGFCFWWHNSRAQIRKIGIHTKKFFRKTIWNGQILRRRRSRFDKISSEISVKIKAINRFEHICKKKQFCLRKIL